MSGAGSCRIACSVSTVFSQRECPLAREHLEQDRSQREQIRAAVRFPP
jgi:hypothetical protein